MHWFGIGKPTKKTHYFLFWQYYLIFFSMCYLWSIKKDFWWALALRWMNESWFSPSPPLKNWGRFQALRMSWILISGGSLYRCNPSKSWSLKLKYIKGYMPVLGHLCSVWSFPISISYTKGHHSWFLGSSLYIIFTRGCKEGMNKWTIIPFFFKVSFHILLLMSEFPFSEYTPSVIPH